MQIHTPGTSRTTWYQNPLVVFCKKAVRNRQSNINNEPTQG